MAEADSSKFVVGESNPTDFTVGAVNAALTDKDPAEVRRVLEAESTGQARKGILEGPHALHVAPGDESLGEGRGDSDADGQGSPDAPQDGPGGGESPSGSSDPTPPTDAEREALRQTQQETERTTGFLGETGETPDGQPPVQPVGESAPDDVNTDPSAGVVVANGENLRFNPPRTMAEQTQPSVTGKPYRQGYFGQVPTDENGDRPDLTLAGVLGLDSAPQATKPDTHKDA